MLAVRENVMRAFQHRDFRLLWFGAFLSFVGSWIQNVGERWLVNEMFDDAFKVAFIAFCGSAPVALLGPFAGTLADAFDKKLVLNIAQALFGLGATFLGVMCLVHRIEYWEIVAVALLFGMVSAFENPTRQSVVSRVVPVEDLAQAVPLNAMTFNIARLIGPGIAGVLLAVLTRWFDQYTASGVCYVLNGISYVAIIFAVLAMVSDLKPRGHVMQPVGDLIMEGMLYTFRDGRFRTLFIMEAIASSCGMFYMAVMPTFTKDILGLGPGGLAAAYVMVGVGAIVGLLLMTTLADLPIKGLMVRWGMAVLGVGIIFLGFVTSLWLVFPVLAIIGGAVLIQFNTTNTLFQLLSPDRLRGRVLAMHQWAVGGIGPFGTLAFGWFAGITKTPHTLKYSGFSIAMPVGGIPLALKIGGACILVGAIWGSVRIRSLSHLAWELESQSL